LLFSPDWNKYPFILLPEVLEGNKIKDTVESRKMDYKNAQTIRY
jgi:hypothetical protein